MRFERSKVLNAYREKEAKFSDFRKARKFLEARTLLDELIELIQKYPDDFDELSDRVNILEARKVSLLFEEERLRGCTSLPILLREIADLNLPSKCIGHPCLPAESGALCVTQQISLSVRHKKMCVERLNALSQALKIEAAHAAHIFDYSAALTKLTLAANMHKSVFNFDSSQQRVQNQTYLEYWRQIYEGSFSILLGEFEASRTAFSKALETSGRLNERKCFPNYFRSPAEIAIHKYYINAVECVSVGDFVGAKYNFSAWLIANTDKRPSLRTENIAVFAAICDILNRLALNNLMPRDWNNLEQLLDRRYTAKTTWALWQRLQWPREIAFKARQGATTVETLIEAVKNLSKEWQLFVLEAILLGEDRDASLTRRISYSSLIDILEHIDPCKHDWRSLLVQNLRHMLLLMADYEYLRYLDPPADDAKHPMTNPIKYKEDMSCRKLFQIVMHYLRIRSEDHAMIFERAAEHFDRFSVAIDNGEYPAAIESQRLFFDAIRFWPHVIVVNEQSDSPHQVYMDEDAPEFMAYITHVRRLWREIPNAIEFEGPQRLNIGSYYYLRPRWNARKGERYRVRHEQFYESKLPRWISVFVDNLLGRGKVPTARFHDWILQFPEGERLLACRLLSGLKIYDDEAVRNLWASFFKQLPLDVKRDAVFIGLGHEAKSGQHNIYSFRQGISRLPEYEPLYRGRENEVFCGIAEIKNAPKFVVFLDDFVGGGTQAIKYINKYFCDYSWLNNAKIYLGVMIGFRTGMDKIKKELEGKLTNVIAAQILEENDRAFSPNNPIWSTSEEANSATAWANRIGHEVLKGKEKYESERDALGYEGCQALVAFDYNVPNNTLPLFWSDGECFGKPWNPLLERTE